MANHNSFSYRESISIQKTLFIYLTLFLFSNFALAEAGSVAGGTGSAVGDAAGADATDAVTPPAEAGEASPSNNPNPAMAAFEQVTDANALREAREIMMRGVSGDPRMSYVPVRPSFNGERPTHLSFGQRLVAGVTSETISCTRERARELLANLRYMGRNFPVQTTALCVRAYTDAEAAERGGRFINPANPDYENALAGGSQAYNPAGFYIQIANVPANSKEELCVNPNFRSLTDLDFRNVSDADIKSYLSPRPQQYRNNYPGGGLDTVCTCLSRTMQNPSGTPLDCTGSQFRVRVEEAVNNLSASQIRITQIDQRRDRQIQAAAASPASPDSTVATPPQNTPNTNVVAQCIQEYWTRSENCRRLTEAATSACNTARESNAPTDAIGQVLGAGADMNTMMRAGTGNQGNCMRASVLAMGAREAMRGMGQSCSREVNSCKDSCKSDSYDTFIRQCLQNNNTSVALIESMPAEDPAARAFRQRNEGIRANYENGVRVCGRELRSSQSDISNLMTGMGNSLQASMTCACQTSNAPGAECNAVPNINNCDTDPSIAGCQLYGPIGSCVPGAVGYDAKTCNCLQNPTASGCGTAGGTTPTSLFGGNLRGGPAAGGSFAGGGAGAAGAGGGRASNLDLGSSPDAVTTSLSGDGSLSAAAKPGGAYGGSVGGGGGGNGNASDEAAAAGAPPEGGLGGLFNQAKNAVMNALGKGTNRNTRTAGRNANIDPNKMKKFKPLRGLANSEGMGTKNMDIWKMVNMCANGETCASNRNNYMMTP